MQPSATSDSTNAHSVTLSPDSARMRVSVKRTPAMAMERVAEPAPSLAFTTSSPPNWMRWVRLSMSSCVKLAPSTCAHREQHR